MQYEIYSLFFNGIAYGRTSNYFENVIVNAVSKECRENNKCLESIIEGELHYATKLFLSEIFRTLENYSGDIFRNLRRDLENKNRNNQFNL